jgi:biotin carboxyl carrier protein
MTISHPQSPSSDVGEVAAQQMTYGEAIRRALREEMRHSITWMPRLCAWAARKYPCHTRPNSKNAQRRKKKIFTRQRTCYCNRSLHRSSKADGEALTMPKLGATMTEGTVLRWLYQPGQWVTKGEPLVEVMTDKVNIEVEAPISGRLIKVLAQDGDVLPIGTPLALLVDDSDIQT